MIKDSRPDTEFFRKLFELYAKDVRASLHRQSIPATDREDLVHDVFAIAMSKYDRASPAKAWLLMVAHNLTRNHRRRPHRHELTSYPAEPVEHRSPEQYVSDREIHVCVHGIIDGLPDELRVPFTLAYIDNIPIDEIAKLLKVTPSTVQSLLRRARKAFIDEGRRRDAAGDLLTVSLLMAGMDESRLRAGIDEVLKYASGAAVGAALAFALTYPPVTPTLLHAERTHLAETRWYAMPVSPVVDLPPSPAIDVVPAALLPQPAIDVVPPSPLPRLAPDDVDESVRDELALMDRATWATRQGNYAEALRCLERHRRIYPNGKLSARRDKLIQQVQQLTGRSTKISG